MDAVFALLNEITGGDSTLLVSVFVFLSAGALAFGVMAIIQVRVAVKRRAAGIGTTDGRLGDDDPRSLRYASKIATQRLLEYTSKHYSGENTSDVKELRRRLIQAGYLDPRAPSERSQSQCLRSWQPRTSCATTARYSGRWCSLAAFSGTSARPFI